METVTRHVIVDGANVVGSRPDGWWRDRAGAAARLAAHLVAALDDKPAQLAELGGGDGGDAPMVHLVLEGVAARAEGVVDEGHLRIVRAPADGDSAIVELAEHLRRDSPPGVDVVVVTADRLLRSRVEAAGALPVGPGALLALWDS